MNTIYFAAFHIICFSRRQKRLIKDILKKYYFKEMCINFIYPELSLSL
ncbi:hypothetical protein PRABACTJOHN_01315 [Parabacteroides johnsonii DSM 18315]|uniref:Transposase IS200-like domain-containing protein n=1 Tax=Parabacteroides johnsonii DSM 18315 TaxID=537006 RepID=B7B8G4_9BACT|nr:hypothetical protein PRABACTJOHN_01315 [Parabacteroides johnsonii DSM 18315]